tara:strand:- start:566 stop:1006 length:441 start_codon:yes stop_codon:yes gene_type:complete
MLNIKFLNISLKSWLMIIVTIVFLIFKKNPEKFSKPSLDTSIKSCKETSEIKDNKIKVYNFNTVWCGISRDFQSNWDKFVKDTNESDIDLIDVKCDDKKNKKLCEKYNIPGYPTVLFVKGSKIGEYAGDRTPSDLTTTLQNFKKLN